MTGECRCIRGLMPRLIGDLLTLWLANILTFVLNNLMVKSSSQPGAKVYLRHRWWGGCVYVLQMLFFLFFLFSVFSVRHKNTRQPFSGTAERIFMKLLPNDSGENGVCIAIPKWRLGPPINFLGAKNYTLHTWWSRLANDSEKITLCWSTGYGTVQLQRLRYKCMKEWMHLI